MSRIIHGKMKMKKPERSVYTHGDFSTWRDGGTLELTPKFQRRGVWSPSARSYFIDSLLRLMPVPPIYIRMLQGPGGKGTIRQVVAGQQRLSCVLDFVDGKFRLSKSVAKVWGHATFDKLNQEQKESISSYSFAAEVFHGISDADVLEIFARLNTYSVPLNSQELRNGRYFGLFKQTAYRLAHEHLEFWRLNGVFTERSIARMLEVELTSELLIAEIDGMQDKKKSIDRIYAEYDEEFSGQESYERKFREIINEISEGLSNSLKATEFSSPPLFYTLFCCLYHHRFGLPGLTLSTPKKALSKSEQLSLREAVTSLSDVLVKARNEESIPSKLEGFVLACQRQTDNIKPRATRFSTLYSRIFS